MTTTYLPTLAEYDRVAGASRRRAHARPTRASARVLDQRLRGRAQAIARTILVARNRVEYQALYDAALAELRLVNDSTDGKAQA